MAHISAPSEGERELPGYGGKWSGICAGPGGKLYCAPFLADTVRLGLFGSVSQVEISYRVAPVMQCFAGSAGVSFCPW